METGIISYGTYVPHWRLAADTVRDILGEGRGGSVRAVAGYDEDTTTMALEAGRVALRGGVPADLRAVTLSTGAPVYASKTNATAVHAALALPAAVRAADANGPERAGSAALVGALENAGSHLVILSDSGTGPAGSADETGLGDAAAAFVTGSADPIAELLASASGSEEFLDRWSAPGELFDQTWEERFGQEVYTRLGVESVAQALEAASVPASQVTSFAITGLSPRAAAGVAKKAGMADVLVDDLVRQIGRTGSAHAGILLADALDRAEPGDIVVLTVLADGADTLVFRVTDAITSRRAATTVAQQIAAGDDSLGYVDFLSWKGLLTRQGPRRPEPARAAAPPAHRRAGWKFGFTGSVCEDCGTRHLPPQRVCLRCGATDRMGSERLADVRGTITTYTVDHLAFSLAPPVIGVVIDFDGGGRFACELTDADLATVKIGDRVGMTFRKINEADGITNYFWKARLIEE